MPHINKQMISFFLTTKCNLCCVYCYNAKERASLCEQTLSLEIAKAGIDKYFRENESRHIRFYGPGEPTQEFELMKDITEYARSIAGDAVTMEIQTNGIFNSRIRSWMLENANIIWMSFDGPPDIQNYNRPLNPAYKAGFGGATSARILEDNVRWLIKGTGNHSLTVGARVTITERSISRQKEMVDYFCDLGIKYIWTDPMFPSVGKVPVCDDIVKQASSSFDMNAYVDKYIEAYFYAKEKGVFYGSFLACNFDGFTNKHCRACTPTPHLTPDGYVSACDMVTFGKNAHHMSCFVYGKWDDTSKEFIFDEKKISRLQNRSVGNMPQCAHCEVKDHCGGYCLGEITNETGDMYGCKPVNCEAIKRIYLAIGSSPEAYKYLHP